MQIFILFLLCSMIIVFLIFKIKIFGPLWVGLIKYTTVITYAAQRSLSISTTITTKTLIEI